MIAFPLNKRLLILNIKLKYDPKKSLFGNLYHIRDQLYFFGVPLNLIVEIRKEGSYLIVEVV